MIARVSIATVLGAAVAAGLLGLMQVLINTGKTALTDERRNQIVDFVRIPKAETLETKKPKPKKPPEPETPPPDIPETPQDQLDPNAGNINVSAVAVDASIDIGGIGFEQSDGEYLPIVKVAPVYPRRAQERGIEGYVILEFTVTKLGTVVNPVVIETTSSLFNKAAMNAALKFKYKPRVVNGEPVDVAGVLHKITFQLED